MRQANVPQRSQKIQCLLYMLYVVLIRHCVLCVYFRYFLDVCAKQLETRDSFQLLYIHVQLRVGSLTSPSYQLFGLFWYVL